MPGVFTAEDPTLGSTLFDDLLGALAELDGLATLGPEAVLASMGAYQNLEDLAALERWIPIVIGFLEETNAAVMRGSWLSSSVGTVSPDPD